MADGGFEFVSLIQCPVCDARAMSAFPECGGYGSAKHDYVETEWVQFVRVDQVVAALEGLAAGFSEQGDAFMRIHERSKSNTAKAHTWGCAGAHLNAADDVRKLAANLTPTNKQED